MCEHYLILHKVRGEPAFDIAIEIETPIGPMWIIPTSGHRAYPFRYWPLDWDRVDQTAPIPPEWPDHYIVNNPEPRLRVVRPPPKAGAKPLRASKSVDTLLDLIGELNDNPTT